MASNACCSRRLRISWRQRAFAPWTTDFVAHHLSPLSDQWCKRLALDVQPPNPRTNNTQLESHCLCKRSVIFVYENLNRTPGGEGHMENSPGSSYYDDYPRSKMPGLPILSRERRFPCSESTQAAAAVYGRNARPNKKVRDYILEENQKKID